MSKPSDVAGKQASPDGEGVYIASRTKHAPKWRALRDAGVPIISTWIDEAEQGQTADFTDLAERCVSEARDASATIVYREAGENLKGALIEVGAALSAGRKVVSCGEWEDWSCALEHHPKWCCVPTVEDAINYLRKK